MRRRVLSCATHDKADNYGRSTEHNRDPTHYPFRVRLTRIAFLVHVHAGIWKKKKATGKRKERNDPAPKHRTDKRPGHSSGTCPKMSNKVKIDNGVMLSKTGRKKNHSQERTYAFGSCSNRPEMQRCPARAGYAIPWLHVSTIGRK